ncbi:S41 family peptidase [Lichenicoccus sp.]|uniref:S41 family peptidase n=1 Tax=Lichenicoccus sp. TaxID=2781899 RepID=UPI003D11FE3A
MVLHAFMACSFSEASAARATLMRYPNASADRLAFVARGQLWIAPLTGGRARELTHDPGDVVAPRLSPDGRHIAFTRWVAGARDVYVIPSNGGKERRLTFDGKGGDGDNLTLGWTPDGARIVFLSSHGASNREQYRAFAVPFKGGLPEDLGLDRAGLMSFSPDGRSIVLNRNFRNFELRKRYVGGKHQNLYAYAFASRRLTRLTNWTGTDTDPMQIGRRVYFISDRGPDFRQNIWVLDLDTRRFHQITHFTDFDVDWPSLGAGGITFQEGGGLYRLDPATERVSELKPDLPEDGAPGASREAEVGEAVRAKDALGGLDYDLSPNGAALLVSARGDIVQVPVHGAASDLTRTTGVDEDHPSWSPDGKWIAYTTDADGEQQIVLQSVASGAARLLTHSHADYFYSAVWSPVGDMMAVADANHALWLVPLDASGLRLVARDPYAEIRDASFSPDGCWLAYSTQRPTRLRAIHLHELASGRDLVVSSPMESDRMPVFTPDGRYLAFVSQRNEQPFVSDRDDESLISTLNSDGVYIAPLSRMGGAPGKGTPASTERNAGTVRVDIDGLISRAVALPVTPAVITTLQARGDVLFYEARPPKLIDGELAGLQPALHALDLATLSDRKLVEGLSSYSLSADGTTVAFRRGDQWMVASTPPHAGAPVVLDFSAIRVPVDPHRGWIEMLQNAWRLDRDVFFNPAMNGTHWQAVHDAYARLWPQIDSEQDFLYLLGQMQGEIASSHTFIDASPAVGPKAPPRTPLLGADYALDTVSGHYRIARIYPGDQSRPALRGPLGAPGLGVVEGDYLLAVDGHELRAPTPPLAAFIGLKGRLSLTVAHTLDGLRRNVVIDPVYDDLPIRRLAWTTDNRALVDHLSGGQLGYVALSDFDDEGSKEFVRQFYPQLDKQGLIFDDRWNRGGFTSQAVLDVLRRLREGVFVNRERALSPLPTAAPPAAMIVIANNFSASDGDQFPYFFRKYRLGPVVGTRTWGGVQGINGAWHLMDGTGIFIPKDALGDRDGNWVIENAGVAPDFAADTAPSDPPGADPQIEAAVRAGLEQLQRHPALPALTPAWLPAYPAAGNVPGASEPAPAPAIR